MITSSIPAANGACTQPTSRYLQCNTTSVLLDKTLDQHSSDPIGCSSFYNFNQIQVESDQHLAGLGCAISSGSASQRTDLQLERDLEDPSPNYCDSCKDLHQIYDALARTKSLPTGSGCTDFFDQLEEDFVDSFPDGCASCKVFHQIQSALALIQLLPAGSVQSKTLRLNGSLIQPLPTMNTINTLHRIQRTPVKVSPATFGPANSSNELEEFRWNSPWIFPCNLSRVTNFLSPLRKRIELLSISVFIASVCLRMLSMQHICV